MIWGFELSRELYNLQLKLIVKIDFQLEGSVLVAWDAIATKFDPVFDCYKLHIHVECGPCALHL